MAFTLPDDLAPELYPLAWLAGTWRGYGILTYGETVPEQAVYQEMTFDHDGGPYLRQTTTIWTVDATRSKNLDFEMPRPPGCLPTGTRPDLVHRDHLLAARRPGAARRRRDHR